MFGGRQSSSKDDSEIERLIKRATDETLTSDNWQYNLEVCDKISENPEENTKQAIKVVAQRMASKDANVILRTLSLLVAIAENCGSRMKQEIATRSFLQDSLVKKLGDRKLHKMVKYRVAEVIKQLHVSFKDDPSLRPMSNAYDQVRAEYKRYLRDETAGPAKPAKEERSQVDKKKEEDELQRVLKLSLQEYEREKAIKQLYTRNAPVSTKNDEAESEPTQDGHTRGEEPKDEEKPSQSIATVSKVRALYDLISYEPDELSFRKGDIITVIESVYRDWWKGSLPNGKVGIFPLNYVTPLVIKSPEELSRESEEENNILSLESRKVDRLLGLLSSNPDTINEDEINKLYGEIVPLKASLAKFIDKYGNRKEDLIILNNSLNNELKYYNDLMDNSINQRVHRHSTSSALPYPSDIPNVSQPGISSYNEQLQYQPTSSGFGNAQVSPTQGRFEQAADSPKFTKFGPETGYMLSSPTQGNNTGYSNNHRAERQQQFLNIESFPEINM